MIGIFTLKVFWNSGGDKPIVCSAIPVLQDTNMLDLIAKEVQDARPNDEIDFAKDIKSITSEPSGTDVIRLSSFPISVYFNNVNEEVSGRELHIIVTKKAKGQESAKSADSSIDLDDFLDSSPKAPSAAGAKRSSSSSGGVFSAEYTSALRARIQKLVQMWADEEQMAGNKVFYWNILNSNQMKEIAAKVPTNKEELAECMIPENFKKEYGDRLLKIINSYIEMENLQKCIDDRQAKKRKKDLEEDGEEDDNSDY